MSTCNRSSWTALEPVPVVRYSSPYSFLHGAVTRMERLQRAKASRKAYRSHLTHTYRKIEDILEAEAPVTDAQIAVRSNN